MKNLCLLLISSLLLSCQSHNAINSGQKIDPVNELEVKAALFLPMGEKWEFHIEEVWLSGHTYYTLASVEFLGGTLREQKLTRWESKRTFPVDRKALDDGMRGVVYVYAKNVKTKQAIKALQQKNIGSVLPEEHQFTELNTFKNLMSGARQLYP